MDKLSYLLSKQDELAKRYEVKRSWYRKASVNDKLVLYMDAIIDESAEVKRHLNWRKWKNPIELDKDAIKDELIDLLHFWLEAANKLQMNEFEIIERYDAKHQENIDRQMGKGERGKEYKADES